MDIPYALGGYEDEETLAEVTYWAVRIADPRMRSAARSVNCQRGR